MTVVKSVRTRIEMTRKGFTWWARISERAEVGRRKGEEGWGREK